MKKFYWIALLIAAIPLVVSAHSGGTDGNGGHMDYSTGEYHYHHGQPAHAHYDMDGDGDVDCPYLFTDATKGYLASSGIIREYDDGYDDGWQVGYEAGNRDGRQVGIDQGQQAGYDQAKAELTAKYEEDLRSACWATAVCVLLFLVIVGAPLVFYISGKMSENERELYEKKLRQLQQQQLEDHNLEVLRRTAPDAEDPIELPEGVWLDVKCIPIKGSRSRVRPFGEYTVYMSANGRKYHRKKGCSGANLAVHLFRRPAGVSPCANCWSSTPEAVPDWYRELQGK